MNILIISDRYFPDNSGTSIRSIALAEGVVRNGIQVEIATLKEFSDLGLNITKEALSFEIINGIQVFRFRSQIEMIFGLIKLIKRKKYHLIHARGPRYGFIAWILWKLFHIPYILEINYYIEQKNLIKKFLLQRILFSSNRIIVLSNFAVDWLVNNFKIKKEKIDVIVNGIEIEKFTLSQSDENFLDLCLDNCDVVGYFGTFHGWQGVFNFVKAAKLICNKNKNVKFLMVGDGPDLNRTIELSKELEINEKFIFTGNVSNLMIPKILSKMDIVLIPRTSELINQIAVPLKILEAMAMEKAIVVTPARSLVEVIEDRFTGLIADYAIEDIVDKVLNLLNNYQLRKFLGKNARNEIMSKYSWSLVSTLLTISYEKAIAK